MVNDVAAMDATLKSLWSGMGKALKAADKAAALAYMNENGKAQYGPVFDKLMTQMAEIVQSFSARRKWPFLAPTENIPSTVRSTAWAGCSSSIS
ncbi:MAG TPA: hypothetical protein VGD30_01130 [Telluria sp.]